MTRKTAVEDYTEIRKRCNHQNLVEEHKGYKVCICTKVLLLLREELSDE